jgi:hypothetical protein
MTLDRLSQGEEPWRLGEQCNDPRPVTLSRDRSGRPGYAPEDPPGRPLEQGRTISL